MLVHDNNLFAIICMCYRYLDAARYLPTSRQGGATRPYNSLMESHNYHSNDMKIKETDNAGFLNKK